MAKQTYRKEGNNRTEWAVMESTSDHLAGENSQIPYRKRKSRKRRDVDKTRARNDDRTSQNELGLSYTETSGRHSLRSAGIESSSAGDYGLTTSNLRDARTLSKSLFHPPSQNATQDPVTERYSQYGDLRTSGASLGSTLASVVDPTTNLRRYVKSHQFSSFKLTMKCIAASECHKRCLRLQPPTFQTRQDSSRKITRRISRLCYAFRKHKGPVCGSAS